MQSERRGHLGRRGSAAIEFLLSVPFLVMFCLFMMDFARGYLSAQRGQRAARHLAWTQSRHEEDGSLPPAPNAQQLYAVHYLSRGGTVASGTSTSYVSLFDETAVGELVGDALEAMDDILEVLGLGRRILPFMGGTVDMTHASVTQNVSNLQRFAQGMQMTQTHWVSLRAYREEDPPRQVGWWDPFVALSEAIGKLGGD